MYDFETVVNFRELGGIKNKFGKTIKHGIFFRSGFLSNLGKPIYSELEKFKNLNIQVIYDLRTSDERFKKPDPVIENVDYKCISCFDESVKQELVSIEQFLKLSKEELTKIINTVNDKYLVMPFDNPAFKAIFKDIVNKKHPLLIHCNAGKDRTGVASALILALLFVDKEEIINDFMKTNKYSHMISDAHIKKYRKEMGDRVELFKQICQVRQIDIEAAFNEIEAQYDTIDNYFEREYGITIEDRKRLAKYYCE